MKTTAIVVLLSSFACACAHTTTTATQPQVVDTHSAEWQPPTDFAWSWQDNGKHRAPTTPTPTETPDHEAQRYQASLTQIKDQISDERLQLQFAEKTYGKTSAYYRNLQRKFCEVDMLIDVRGDGHMKDFCHQK